MEHRPFTWVGTLVPEPYENLATAALVAALLVAFAGFVHRKLAATEAALVPDEGITTRSLAEVFVEAMAALAEGVIGHGSERYVPLLASFFIFIMTANLLGLLPGFVPPTSDFNITLGLGVVSFIAYNYWGVRAQGAAYAKHFLGPVWWLAFIMVVIEVFSQAFRPISLGIRLFANMFADHQVIEMFTGLIYLGAVVFYVLGAFVSVLQAFIFTMLSAIYIAGAVSHEH